MNSIESNKPCFRSSRQLLLGALCLVMFVTTSCSKSANQTGTQSTQANTKQAVQDKPQITRDLMPTVDPDASQSALVQNRGTDMPCDFKGQIGVISFVNDSSINIEVTLWHSRTRTVLSRWEFAPGEAAYLNYQGKRIRIGDDWGIQLGSSKVRCVGSVSSYEDGEFEVKKSSF